MGATAISNQDYFFDSDSFVTEQLCEQDLGAYTVAADEFANEYKALGEAYHKLPQFIRSHQRVRPEWREYCEIAFTVEETRELPDMLQILGMLDEEFKRVRAAMNCEDFGLARFRLHIIYFLLREADHHVSGLEFALRIFALVLQYTMVWEEKYPVWASSRRHIWNENSALLNGLAAKWWKALPEHLRSDTDHDVESGTGSPSIQSTLFQSTPVQTASVQSPAISSSEAAKKELPPPNCSPSIQSQSIQSPRISIADSGDAVAYRRSDNVTAIDMKYAEFEKEAILPSCLQCDCSHVLIIRDAVRACHCHCLPFSTSAHLSDRSYLLRGQGDGKEETTDKCMYGRPGNETSALGHSRNDDSNTWRFDSHINHPGSFDQNARRITKTLGGYNPWSPGVWEKLGLTGITALFRSFECARVIWDKIGMATATGKSLLVTVKDGGNGSSAQICMRHLHGGEHSSRRENHAASLVSGMEDWSAMLKGQEYG
ncbi:uncharacterized protein MYCFIDRAFT_173963 [Pseudocercospora fijiensis CIRAD86]|uniref:Uncharacterized protein n=1 Tax=Pseudocercospora fijiensis (strain CIRAD86) TaxID=383855 RepID=M3B6Z5_PSEFD|nr:uncharacterized protein MYCFIDRAFT_173963 [Pseudocercospora fijiensis CIRAD86]EME85103.1 hypothetical protein MYCFIDRAFT_173963 [Pseudocercospora fijiensis CIRAD86]